MNDQPDCYVAGVLALMLRVSRLTGLAPLNFVKKGSGWRVSFSPCWCYCGYFIASIIIITTVSVLMIDLHLSDEHSWRMVTSTSRVVWVVDVACMLLIAGTSVCEAPTQMRAMIAWMNRIEKINMDLNIRSWPMYSERKKNRFFFFWLTATLVVTAMDYMKPIFYQEQTKTTVWINLMYSFYYYCYWILQLRELNFVFITLHVMYCFRTVNNNLKSLLRELVDRNELPLSLLKKNLHKTPKKKLFKVNVNVISDFKKPRPEGIQKNATHLETLRRLALSYANTCDVVRDVDTAHGLIVLMMLGSFLLHLICTPYYVITAMLQNNNVTEKGVYIGLQFLWCLYHTGNLLMVIEPCHLTQMEMETTRELVSHLTRCTNSIYDPLAMELEMFFKHLYLNQVSYSAMHVTTISRSLVATIFGSITTYLVIIIQL